MSESAQKHIKKNRHPRVHIEYDTEVDEQTIKHLADIQLKYSLAGLCIGAVSIILGCSLLYFGITGSSSFIANTVGLKTELNDAAPGTVLLVVGLLIIVITKFSFTIKKRK